MKIKSLLSALINASEKAANIARTCRSNRDLFNLLIEEKKGSEKNERFFQDFKTLADVLIQESIRYDISELFPNLKDKINGEESNKFENALGEKIVVEISEDSNATTEMLLRVLDENENAAVALSNVIHREVFVYENLSFDDFEVSDNLGIWIDPIDGTQEYITGGEVQSEIPEITKSGLKCATVLIGVYEIESGTPIIGVINQPFADDQQSKIFYGFSVGENRQSNIDIKSERNPLERISVLSSSESVQSSFKPVCAAGAGYKALTVIQGSSDIYYLTKGSTFKWDTCGPQAILQSLGGDILDMKKSLEAKQPVSLSYTDSEEKSNSGGIIAYRKVEDFRRLLDELSGK